MQTTLRFLAVLEALAVGCAGDSIAPADASPVTVTIDTFNVALAGSFIPFEAERRQPVAAAIGSIESDIVCLQEVWTQDDKNLIREAAGERLPHAVLFENTLDTPLDDPTDQRGEIPSSPTDAPCPETLVPPANSTLADQVNQAIDCLAQNCSTMPGSDQGRTTSTACAASSCVGTVGALLLGNEEEQRCYACAATQLPTETLADIRSRCTTVANQELAFQGQNGVMILSRYPLTNQAQWVLPGTWNRRVIISATAQLPNGSELGVYCYHLSAIFMDFTLPYTGLYGDGKRGAAGWEAEQFLQAGKLLEYVQKTSADAAAVVLGDPNASRQHMVDGSVAIFAEGQPTLELLESILEPGYAVDYEPQCTFCETNSVAGTDRSVWIDHILLYNLGLDSVVSTVRTFDESVVAALVEDGNGGTVAVDIPLPDHFGVRSVITVP